MLHTCHIPTCELGRVLSAAFPLPALFPCSLLQVAFSFRPEHLRKVCTLEDATRELPIMFSQEREKKMELVLALFPSISVPFIYFEQIVLKFIVNCLSYRAQTYPHGDE